MGTTATQNNIDSFVFYIAEIMSEGVRGMKWGRCVGFFSKREGNGHVSEKLTNCFEDLEVSVEGS